MRCVHCNNKKRSRTQAKNFRSMDTAIRFSLHTGDDKLPRMSRERRRSHWVLRFVRNPIVCHLKKSRELWRVPGILLRKNCRISCQKSRSRGEPEAKVKKRRPHDTKRAGTFFLYRERAKAIKIKLCSTFSAGAKFDERSDNSVEALHKYQIQAVLGFSLF